MGYTVETSLPLHGRQAQNSTVCARRSLATQHGCDSQYFTHVAEGRGKNTHQLAIVHTAAFPSANLQDLMKYVQDARRSLRVRVSCVYQGEASCRMLYASGRYLRQLPLTESRALRRKLEEAEAGDLAIAALASACAGRAPPHPRGENMCAVYTHGRADTEPARESGEEQESQGRSLHLPVQVQAGGASGVPGDGKRGNMRH